MKGQHDCLAYLGQNSLAGVAGANLAGGGPRFTGGNRLKGTKFQAADELK